MALPIEVRCGLSQSHCQNWQARFVATKRTALEGLWRRTQEEVNKDLSGWTGDYDRRRRMLHYIDQYDDERQTRWSSYTNPNYKPRGNWVEREYIKNHLENLGIATDIQAITRSCNNFTVPMVKYSFT